jgi:hypothetical protein
MECRDPFDIAGAGAAVISGRDHSNPRSLALQYG